MRNRAFTLIEAIVVMAMVMVVLCLVLPAIQSAYERRRHQDEVTAARSRAFASATTLTGVVVEVAKHFDAAGREDEYPAYFFRADGHDDNEPLLNLPDEEVNGKNEATVMLVHSAMQPGAHVKVVVYDTQGGFRNILAAIAATSAP